MHCTHTWALNAAATQPHHHTNIYVLNKHSIRPRQNMRNIRSFIEPPYNCNLSQLMQILLCIVLEIFTYFMLFVVYLKCCCWILSFEQINCTNTHDIRYVGRTEEKKYRQRTAYVKQMEKSDSTKKN